MSKTFRQYDSRWGSKNYNGTSTMAAAGCGPTSCADIIYNLDTTITPWKVAKWMKEHGYAVPGHGTAWAGIPACLKAFGCGDVQNPKVMKDVFGIMKKDGYCAVFLFEEGTRGGVTWTTSGHFLAATDYKAEGGRHYFYMRDPGQRRNDGWKCYETQMSGLIEEIWTCHVAKLNGKPRSTNSDANEKIAKMAVKLAYKKGTAKSKYGYPKGKPTDEYKKALNKAYPGRGWSKPAHDGASCDVFVGVVMRNTVDKKFPRGFDEQWDYVKKSSKYKTVKSSEARRGDIIQYKRKDGGVHTVIITGHNVAEASYNGFYPIIRNVKSSRLSKSGKKALRVVRYKG